MFSHDFWRATHKEIWQLCRSFTYHTYHARAGSKVKHYGTQRLPFRKFIFQPSIFRGEHVSFRECKQVSDLIFSIFNISNPRDPGSPCQMMSKECPITSETHRSFRFHETILSFGELIGSLGKNRGTLKWMVFFDGKPY